MPSTRCRNYLSPTYRNRTVARVPDTERLFEFAKHAYIAVHHSR
jgi:hypothetical protein